MGRAWNVDRLTRLDNSPAAMDNTHAQTVRSDWGVIAWAVGGGIVAALHVGKGPPALPLLRADLDLSLVAAGFVVSVFNALGMLFALPMGVLADRLGRRHLLGAGFLFLAVGGIGGAMAGTLPLLLLSRFVEGVGFIAVIVSAPAIIVAAAQGRDRPLALSLWSVFMPAGMTVALVAAPPILGAVGWRGLWLVIAGCAAAAFVGVLRATARVALPEAVIGKPLALVMQTLNRSGLRWLALAFAAYAFQWVSLMVWLPTFLTADLGAAPATAALLTALVVAVNVPSNVLGGWLLRRGAARVVLIGGGSVIMGLCGWGIFTDGLADLLRFALCLVFSFVAGVIPASLFAGTPVHAASPGHMAAANGLLMQGSNFGQFIGPPLVAAAVAAVGGVWTGAALPLVAGAILTLAAGLMAGRAEARLPARPLRP